MRPLIRMNIEGPAEIPNLPTSLNLRRLVWLRTIAIPGSAICMLLARQLDDLPIRTGPLVSIVVGLALVNLWTWRRLKDPAAVSNNEFFAQMLIDVAALAGIMYFSGGTANPFAFFFLLPLTITATLLPRPYTWMTAAAAAACYTLLLVIRVPLPQLTPGRSLTTAELHVVSMWFGFVVIAGLIAIFVARMGETLREQDKSLAEARERALRDERVLGLATLAAGAAHELSTPLATMAIVAAELAHEYPRERFPQLHDNLEILRQQIRQSKDALSVMSASAGATRAEAAKPMRVTQFVGNVVAEVRRLRPGAEIALQLNATGQDPDIIVERTLTQAILNILHNAVDVSPQNVRVQCRWDATDVRIEVRDRGPGIDTVSTRPGNLPAASTKETGLGLGLFLSRTALSQLGGELAFGSADGGGTCVKVRLPLRQLQAAQPG